MSALNRNVIITAMQTQWIVLSVIFKIVDSRQSGPKLPKTSKYSSQWVARKVIFFLWPIFQLCYLEESHATAYISIHIFFSSLYTYYTYLLSMYQAPPSQLLFSSFCRLVKTSTVFRMSWNDNSLELQHRRELMWHIYLSCTTTSAMW